MKSINVTAIAAALVLAGASAAQAADTVNINAQTNGGGSGNPVTWTGGAGEYTITAIGTADGGQFDAWSSPNVGCIEVCTPQWHWNFSAIAQGDDTLHFVGIGNGFATAGAALTAAQTAAAWNSGTFALPNGPFVPGMQPTPFTFTLDGLTTLLFTISDGDNNYANNAGGVSFRIAAAVPEPATWAMLIGGFGMIGLAMRRRRALAAA